MPSVVEIFMFSGAAVAAAVAVAGISVEASVGIAVAVACGIAVAKGFRRGSGCRLTGCDDEKDEGKENIFFHC